MEKITALREIIANEIERLSKEQCSIISENETRIQKWTECIGKSDKNGADEAQKEFYKASGRLNAVIDSTMFLNNLISTMSVL